jgi:hypothetical protein
LKYNKALDKWECKADNDTKYDTQISELNKKWIIPDYESFTTVIYDTSGFGTEHNSVSWTATEDGFVSGKISRRNNNNRNYASSYVYTDYSAFLYINSYVVASASYEGLGFNTIPVKKGDLVRLFTDRPVSSDNPYISAILYFYKIRVTTYGD